MARSDPALDLARLFESLVGLSTNTRTGSNVLAEFFGVSEWSTEFFQLGFAVSERIDDLEKLIGGDPEIDEELRGEYSAHLNSLRQAFSINAFSNSWDWAVRSALTPDRLSFLKGISPTVRRRASYDAPDEESVTKVVTECDKLLTSLEKTDLERYDFLRVAMVLGLKELRFRLTKLRFFGHVKASEAFSSLAAVYFAMRQVAESENGVEAKRLSVFTAQLTKFAQGAYGVLNKGKEVVETTKFWILLAGIAATQIQPLENVIAGLLPAPPPLLEHKPGGLPPEPPKQPPSPKDER